VIHLGGVFLTWFLLYPLAGVIAVSVWLRHRPWQRGALAWAWIGIAVAGLAATLAISGALVGSIRGIAGSGVLAAAWLFVFGGGAVAWVALARVLLRALLGKRVAAHHSGPEDIARESRDPGASELTHLDGKERSGEG
jgi:hypothetical protein